MEATPMSTPHSSPKRTSPCNPTYLRRRLASAGLVTCVCLAAASAGGCRSVDNAQVDLMERELRHQENYIYELEDYLVEYSEKLRQCRCENVTTSNARTLRDAAADEMPEPELADETRRLRPGEPEGAPSEELDYEFDDTIEETTPPAEGLPDPTDDSFDPGQLDVPELEVGPGAAAETDEAVQTADTRFDDGGNGDERYLLIPDPADYLAEEDAGGPNTPSSVNGGQTEPLPLSEAPEGAALEPIASDEAAPADEALRPAPPRSMAPTTLQIRRVFADVNSDDSPPSRLLVVVEALNDAGEPVDAEGDVSLMVMTSDAPGSLQRLDRWDFNPEEARAAWQSSHLGDGLHLELPLRQGSLPEGTVQLWARLVTADGDKLLTQLPIVRDELATFDDASAQPNSQQRADAPIELADSEQRWQQAETSPAPGSAADGAQWRPSNEAYPALSQGFASTSTSGGVGWKSSANSQAVASAPVGQAPIAAAPTSATPAVQQRPPEPLNDGGAPRTAKRPSPQRDDAKWNPLR